MPKLVLLRHGESIWNRENLFTGWTDVDLSGNGLKEASRAGMILKEAGFVFDVCFTSVLKRAIRTLWIVLDHMDFMWLPVHCTWRLNERHYGALQGLNKNKTAAQYGAAKVHHWRRSYDAYPPSLDRKDARYPGHDPRYSHLDANEIPLTESLRDTEKRVVSYWHETIVFHMRAGKRVLITAHGNSLRALVKHLDNLTTDDVEKLEIPTGIPLVYEVDDNIHATGRYYLVNQGEAK